MSGQGVEAATTFPDQGTLQPVNLGAVVGAVIGAVERTYWRFASFILILLALSYYCLNSPSGCQQELWREVLSGMEQAIRPNVIVGSLTHGAYLKGSFHIFHASAGTGVCCVLLCVYV